MKKKKILYWLNQIRRPICFISVLSIVVIYILSYPAYAFSSGSETFISRFGIDTTSQNYAFYYRNGIAQYSAAGNNSSNLASIFQSPVRTGWAGTLGSWWFTWFDAFNYDPSVTIDSVTYDLSNAYVIADSNDSWVDSNGRGVKFIVSDGYVALANTYLVSNSMFHVIYYDSGGTLRVNHISAPEECGLYMTPITSYAFGNQDYTIGFTSLDVFLSSTDGASGFTTLSTSATDLDLTSSLLFNFNSLKNDGLIINSGDPLPSSGSYGDYAKSRMNFSMTSYYTGGKMLNNAKQHVTIVWPEVVINHPENFVIYADYTGKYQDGSLASVVTFNHKAYHNVTSVTLPVTYLMKNGKLPTSFDISIPLADIVDANNKSMYRYFLESVSSFSGSSIDSVINNNIWLQFLNDVGEAVADFFGADSDLEPLASLVQNIQSYITTMEIDGYVRLVYLDDDVNYQTGPNHSRFNFITGDSNIIAADNTINQYPDEGQDPYQVPSTSSGGSTSNYSYGGTVVNANNSFNAMLEYLYNLDTSDLNNITGNIANNFQYVINQVSDTSDNGFWGVLKETYDLIPEPIWTWLKVAVGVILGSCVYQWVLGGVRIKRG